MDSKSIYIVLSGNDTLAGYLIRFRASLKFWNRYSGDCYNHTSISLDDTLTNMMSFARKKINNPLCAGLIREDIHTGIFKRSGNKSHMAVIKVPVNETQYKRIHKYMLYSWKMRDYLKYDFGGLFWMMISAKGKPTPNRYVCSHWVSKILYKSGIGKQYFREPWNIRPFDFYEIFKGNIVYEGKTNEYDRYLEEVGRCRDQ